LIIELVRVIFKLGKTWTGQMLQPMFRTSSKLH
jgi:hypothetical protein